MINILALQNAPSLITDCEDVNTPLNFEPNHSSRGIPAELVNSTRTGLETLWGFLLRTEPHVLYIMSDPVAGLVRDERRARKLAKTLGSAFEVRATVAPELIAAGLRDVGSYGQDVLERVFPAVP
jgi:hypothetical protein